MTTWAKAVEWLLALQKPMILVMNKSDRYSREEQAVLLERLLDHPKPTIARVQGHVAEVQVQLTLFAEWDRDGLGGRARCVAGSAGQGPSWLW